MEWLKSNTKLDQYRPPSQDKRHEDDVPEDEDDAGDFEEKVKKKEESGKNLSVNRDKGMSLTPDISPKSSQAGREEEEKSKEYVKVIPGNNYKANNKYIQKRPQSVIKVNHNAAYKLNTSAFVPDHDKDIVNTSLLLSNTKNKQVKSKIEEELDELKQRNEELKKNIETVKADKNALIKETTKINNEINQMLKSKEMVTIIQI